MYSVFPFLSRLPFENMLVFQYNRAFPREEDLIDRFRNGTLSIFDRRGYDVRDFWIAEKNSEIVYVMTWKDGDHMRDEWNLFRADPEWVELKRSTEANGPLVEKIISDVLVRPPVFQPHADAMK